MGEFCLFSLGHFYFYYFGHDLSACIHGLDSGEGQIPYRDQFLSLRFVRHALLYLKIP